MIFNPYDYQSYAIDFIKTHPAAAIFLDCGLGKTAISLTAIKDLLETGEISKVLVVAPLRVARDVWPQESEKWLHLKDLKVSVVLGTPKQRLKALQEDAQIYVTNRDNIQWLVAQKWPIFQFDAVVLDELSSFKNEEAKRTRAVFRLCREAKRVIGLTGTPASNSLLDLWSEYFALDRGLRLGTSKKAYQQRYFMPVFGYMNYIKDWKIKPGAEKAIYAAIADITISVQAMDHLEMPDLVSSEYRVYMSDQERRFYDTLTKQMFLNLNGGEITAKNAMSLGTKLIQMSNGLVYGSDGTPLVIHSRKIEALEDLLEAANGKPVMVVYNYRHDLVRISAMLRDKGYVFSQLDSKESIRSWNRGELQVGLINPQSAGHGLNLQEGGSRIIWYSLPWSLENYHQCNARLWRIGQKSDTVVIQHIITEGTIDERIMAVLRKKDKTQNALIDAVKAEFNGEKQEAVLNKQEILP